MDTVNVLVLYGGEKATAPREKILTWLNMPEFHAAIGKRVDARKVAAMVANAEGSIDQRVEEMMDWADKGIFLFTPDHRGKYGAPNVLEEFGRWIGQKGRKTMLTLRHKEVEVHSNASGLVYVGFEDDDDVITKCRERIVAFINEVIPPEEIRGEPELANQILNQSGTAANLNNIGGNVAGGINQGAQIQGQNQGVVHTGTGDVTTSIHHHYHGQGASQGSNLENPENEVIPNQSNTNGITKELSVAELRSFVSKHFSFDEIKGICLDLEIDPDDLGSGKSAVVLELLPYLQRRNNLNALLTRLLDDPSKRLQEVFNSYSDFTIRRR